MTTGGPVVVTGASGMLGRAVARTLADAGHAVRTLQRSPSGLAGHRSPTGGAVEDVAVDLAAPGAAPALRAVLEGAEAVVHLAAKVSVSGPWAAYRRTNVEGTQRLLDAAGAAGVRRFVQVSSPSVAHAGEPLVGVPAGPADPGAARGRYARSKAMAEQAALAADGRDLAVVAVRPHLVWGPGDTQLVARVVARSRAGRLPLLDGGTALVDSTYVDDAADALAAAAARAADPQVHGRALVVSSGEPRTVGELLASLCAAHGAPLPARSVPAGLARAAGGLVEALWAVRPGLGGDDEPPMTRFLAEQLSTAHWFDQRETRRLLRWSPRVGLDAGFARLAAAAAAA
ncbi:NAD(P)-dependent oxidoreductase [uncultured Pseudokineococcus sp.]|uniref:NAD-dependent epimerase/dehydratase family protein n=1 Tax=uncultured Pseudokineococcus sp. TaxID=1642928 RepID=UPI0026040B30|nr:NAD-dependent epimerase/dehydratase family protein [uncultured Pseudokineococcus sp.]